MKKTLSENLMKMKNITNLLEFSSLHSWLTKDASKSLKIKKIKTLSFIKKRLRMFRTSWLKVYISPEKICLSISLFAVFLISTKNKLFWTLSEYAKESWKKNFLKTNWIRYKRAKLTHALHLHHPQISTLKMEGSESSNIESLALIQTK